jgi:glucose-6-phosphate 1-dehydrogenase
LITGVGKVFLLRSHGQKNAGKTILYCHTVPAGTAFHLSFGKEGMMPNRLIINIQPAMDIRLQFMTKTRFVTFVETSGNGFDYFFALPNHLKLTKHWY